MPIKIAATYCFRLLITIIMGACISSSAISQDLSGSDLNDKPAAPAADKKEDTKETIPQAPESLEGKTDAPAASAASTNPDATPSDIAASQNGSGVKTDINALEVSAQNGNIDAQLKLANMYYLGLDGTPKNDAKSIEWLKKAAEVGNPRAQYRLASAYFHGSDAIKQDYMQSYMWISLMITQKNPEAVSLHARAKNRIQQLESQMTPEQIQEGKDLTKIWIQQHSYIPKEYLP